MTVECRTFTTSTGIALWCECIKSRYSLKVGAKGCECKIAWNVKIKTHLSNWSQVFVLNNLGHKSQKLGPEIIIPSLLCCILIK